MIFLNHSIYVSVIKPIIVVSQLRFTLCLKAGWRLLRLIGKLLNKRLWAFFGKICLNLLHLCWGVFTRNLCEILLNVDNLVLLGRFFNAKEFWYLVWELMWAWALVSFWLELVHKSGHWLFGSLSVNFSSRELAALYINNLGLDKNRLKITFSVNTTLPILVEPWKNCSFSFNVFWITWDAGIMLEL